MIDDIIKSMAKLAKEQAKSITDDTTALSVKYLYPEWKTATAYIVGNRVNRNDTLYKCITAHTSQAGWEPEKAASLWAKVLIPDPSVIPEWEQPDSTNGYSTGDKVTHNGKTWISKVNNNVWEPGVTGTERLWEEVTS